MQGGEERWGDLWRDCSDFESWEESFAFGVLARTIKRVHSWVSKLLHASKEPGSKCSAEKFVDLQRCPQRTTKCLYVETNQDILELVHKEGKRWWIQEDHGECLENCSVLARVNPYLPLQSLWTALWFLFIVRWWLRKHQLHEGIPQQMH